MNDNDINKSDHDLIIEIKTILKRAVEDIRDLRDGTSQKIVNLEKRVDDAYLEIDELKGRINTNGAFYKWFVALAIVLISLMSWHILGYKL